MHKSPAIAVDGIIILEGQLVLVKRRNPPFKGMYALPGGFVELGECLEDAVIREVLEETGLNTKVKKLIGVYSDPDRDPRGHTVSVVFELEHMSGKLKAGDDAVGVSKFDFNKLPKLAFDHEKIMSDFLKTQSSRVMTV
jgi:8-oxo-dGTP diphosphatase